MKPQKRFSMQEEPTETKECNDYSAKKPALGNKEMPWSFDTQHSTRALRPPDSDSRLEPVQDMGRQPIFDLRKHLTRTAERPLALLYSLINDFGGG